MKKVVRHIEFLLMTHDCVVIPGFGAVLSRSSEASFDAKTGVWTAPERTFAFNTELTHNDGLLAASIARRDRVSIAVANGIIADAVAVMRRMLETDGSLSLGIVGRLTLLSDGMMTFSPGNAISLSPSLMWLPEVVSPMVMRPSQYEQNIGTELSRRLRIERGLRRAGGWAACLTVITLMGWIISRNMGLNPGAQFASIFPIENSHPSPTPEASPVVLIMATAPADEVVENIMPEPEVKPSVISENHRYCLVVASCATKAEAEKFLSRKNDSTLEIIENDGRWRIIAATGATVEETTNIGNTEPIASRYPSRWVCRK